MANTVSSSFQHQVDTPSDDDVQKAISEFLSKSGWGMKSCFGFPEKQPQFWIKFAMKSEKERIIYKARNVHYSHEAVESFYKKDSS